MKIKIFSSTTSTTDLENKIADWNDALKPEIDRVQVTAYPSSISDVHNSHINYYTEYIATITYN